MLFKTIKKYYLYGITALAVGLLVLCLADTSTAQTSADAIAIRIVPNENHFSALRWYQDQNFIGSPQSLTVDGYEAVRDGRTVYVNVANVSGNALYTNIYLISYNQEAESATIDIFGNILSHWKFNTNLTVDGLCRGLPSVFCLQDDECPIGAYCDSTKARVIRDTRRLADLSEIKYSLEQYRSEYGYYPVLGAGTYLNHRSLSTWPSWQNTLARDLKITVPSDPINDLGDCPGFNEDTCWDEGGQAFATVFPDLPDDSLAYTYSTDVSGASVQLCGVFESDLAVAGEPVCLLSVCLDFDGDGYGSPASSNCLYAELDCNDNNDMVAIGGPETCSNGIDEDCDGLIDCDDSDCSAAPVCSAAVCVPDTCNGLCPAGCAFADDPDCGCGADAWGCCPAICDSFTDSDCSAACVPTTPLCDGTCPAGCAFADDPDCGCGADAWGCCPAICDISTDSDCPEICVDADSDGYFAFNDPFCLSGNDCDDTLVTGGSINPGVVPDDCNGTDNDCDGSIDEDTDLESCWWLCTNLPTGNPGWNHNDILSWRTGESRCCGDDAYEGNPYQDYEHTPSDYCSDGQDNDCDGFCDTNANDCYAGSIPDPDCAGCFGIFTNEVIWYVAGEDCDQCDHEGDDDGDQSPGNWSLYLGMADLCDADCVGSGALVSVSVHFDDFESTTETRCDGIDNDCDGSVDEGCDNDGDGYCDDTMFLYNSNVACLNTVFTGDGMSGDDCDDADAAFHPTAPDPCGDGFDQDCDSIDPPCLPTCTDVDGDRYIFESTNIGLCGNVCGPAADQPCLGNNDCDDNVAWIYPGATETCDGADNNCDSSTDEGCDDDGDGYCDIGMQIYNNTSMCPSTLFTVDGMSGDDCNDALATGAGINPGVLEVCDGVDNNCVNGVDEGFGFEDCLEQCEQGGTTGYIWTGNGGTNNCCGNDPAPEGSPIEIPEILCDFNDNDCDGDIDEGCTNHCTFSFNFPCDFP